MRYCKMCTNIKEIKIKTGTKQEVQAESRLKKPRTGTSGFRIAEALAVLVLRVLCSPDLVAKPRRWRRGAGEPAEFSDFFSMTAFLGASFEGQKEFGRFRAW